LFDGTRAREVPVRLAIENGALVARPVDDDTAPGEERWLLREVRWPERTRHGRRVLHLRDGAQIVCDDAQAFDAWRRHAGIRESWVVAVQQRWRSTLLALVLLLAVAAAGYRWGVPWAGDRLAGALPASADAAVGEAAFASLSSAWAPSALPAARREALQRELAAALSAAYPGERLAPWRLHVVRGGERIGANALALPGGDIVITDEMLALLEGHPDTVLGVLAHEYGHVRHRHGMRAVARFTLLSLATSAALGDFSSVLAAVPALLGHLAYARDAEREADAEAAHVLAASGRAPAAMVVLFEKLAGQDGKAGRKPRDELPFAFASHPADAERVEFFRRSPSTAPR
jgi:predicted Zn-dependent protease